ncbi:unnamed protein product [Adineta steineri]|uniref:Claudin n=1 Tax=Adineta steineri TaxID=433720 RepID=A0A814XCL9_9BILA|nr:unnamed protein product [Adineta steineri]CAF3996405.1 unnamed protein product [Adineta steineri]
MALQNPKRVYVACGILVMVSILYITANTAPIWETESVKSDTGTGALWKLCATNKTISMCHNFPYSMDHKVITTRASLTTCSILSPLSFISILLIIFVNENLKKQMSLIAKVLAIASFISGIIGVTLGITILVDVIQNTGDSMGVSCILAIIAVALNLVGAVITCLIK